MSEEILDAKIKELIEIYESDITIQEELVDKQSLQIPVLLNKYQMTIHKILNNLSELNDKKAEIYHTIMYQYRIGDHRLAKIEWSSTDLKRIVETCTEMREINKQISKRESDLRLLEEMINTLKGLSYNVNNYLTFKKLIGM